MRESNYGKRPPMSKRTKKMAGRYDRRRSYGRCDSIFSYYKVDTVEVRELPIIQTKK